MNSPVVIFVCSCDATRDVFWHFRIAFEKFWSDCPYPTYVGANSLWDNDNYGSFKPIFAAPSSWAEETLTQLKTLTELHPDSLVLLFLDDFILGSPVDTAQIITQCNQSIVNGWEYLRFRRVEEPLISRVYDKLTSRAYVKIPISHPYYSSLQVALWSPPYLTRVIKHSESIWDFERKRLSREHYSVARSSLNYRHVVEKGCWDTGAEDWLNQTIGVFKVGTRQSLIRSRGERLRLIVSKALFNLCGYVPSKIAQKFRK